MKQNRILKYFNQKPHTVFQVSAVVVAVIGFCFVWFLNWWSRGLFLICVGLLMFLVLSLQIKDGELDEASRAFHQSFCKSFEETYIYGDTRKFHQAELKGEPEKEAIYFSGYLLTGDGILSRTGSDGKIRTSVYQSVGIIVGDHSLCIGVQTFNLIDSLYAAPTMAEWKYDKLSRVELLDPVNIHTTHMRILDADGGELIRFQISADAQTDEIICRINAHIQKAHEPV